MTRSEITIHALLVDLGIHGCDADTSHEAAVVPGISSLRACPVLTSVYTVDIPGYIHKKQRDRAYMRSLKRLLSQNWTGK